MNLCEIGRNINLKWLKIFVQSNRTGTNQTLIPHYPCPRSQKVDFACSRCAAKRCGSFFFFDKKGNKNGGKNPCDFFHKEHHVHYCELEKSTLSKVEARRSDHDCTRGSIALVRRESQAADRAAATDGNKQLFLLRRISFDGKEWPSLWIVFNGIRK